MGELPKKKKPKNFKVHLNDFDWSCDSGAF